jgi:rod shape determining protein RodA
MATTTPIKSPADAGAPARSRAGATSFALPFDPVLMLAVIGICVWSLMAIGAATEGDNLADPNFFVKRQLGYFLVGAVIAIVVSRIDYTRLRELKLGLYAGLIGIIVLVFAFGSVTRGSRLSIPLPFFNFQSSELGKILLIVAISAFVVDRARRLQDRGTTMRILLLTLVPAAMVIAQDLGSGLVYIAIGLTVLFVAGTPGRHFAMILAVALSGVALVLAAAPAAGVDVLQGYQKDRLTSFLAPSDDPGDAGYQQNQSRIAIGSGEKTGRGELSTQSTLRFLPEDHTDFVFATVGERWGFVGAGFVLSLYALFVWRAVRILTVAKNLFGALIAGGVIAMLITQVFVNVGMNVGIMPITGIPLPLMTYGGSSVLSMFLAVGLLQSIYAQGRAASAYKGRVLGY